MTGFVFWKDHSGYNVDDGLKRGTRLQQQRVQLRDAGELVAAGWKDGDYWRKD